MHMIEGCHVICHIQDNRSVIVFFKVGHWSDAYRDTGAQPATNASFSAKPPQICTADSAAVLRRNAYSACHAVP